MISPTQALVILQQAELLYSEEQINLILDRMAADITAELSKKDPLILIVMHGAIITAAQLLLRLKFPLKIGYLHATRYQGHLYGSNTKWITQPHPNVKNQVVLVIDDIFDEGLTLKSILDELNKQGAAAIYSAVLVNKHHSRKINGISVNYIGLTIEDYYVFGCGMDYEEYWRNLPAIYAIK